MSNFQHKEGNGALFRNDKQGIEARPDYQGDALIDGKAVWVSGWVKDGKKGKFLSLAFKPKEARGGGNSGTDDKPF